MIGFGFFFRHDLHGHPPFREVALGDGVKQIALRVVWILAAHFFRGFAGKVFNALLGLEVPLHIKKFVFVVNQAERVAAESVHVAITVGCPAIGEENRYLMQ